MEVFWPMWLDNLAQEKEKVPQKEREAKLGVELGFEFDRQWDENKREEKRSGGRFQILIDLERVRFKSQRPNLAYFD